MGKPNGPKQFRRERKPGDATGESENRCDSTDAGGSNQLYGLVPVLEALRAHHTRLEQITIAEGAGHERLRELLDLAKQAKVPVHRAPRLALDRALPGATHQGIIARTAAATYKDAGELLDELSTQVATA